jgi:putative membrane protein
MMGGYGYGYGPSMMAGGGWIGLLLMGFFWLLVTVGVILLIVWVVRSGSHGGRSAGTAAHDDACGIAKVRYAKGEITKEQYLEICGTLKGM